MLLTVKSKVKIFYLDDCTTEGALEEVVADLETIKQLGEEVLNHSISEAITITLSAPSWPYHLIFNALSLWMHALWGPQ